MNFSIRATIRALAAPNCRLSCRQSIWRTGLAELHRRGQGERESGAFLLGTRRNGTATIKRFVFYDDLDPGCLHTGIVRFSSAGYPPLWDICRREGLMVVADVHTHEFEACQSSLDRTNPMIAIAGHVAIIVPWYAQSPVQKSKLGIYRYLGQHDWVSILDEAAERYLHLGMWGGWTLW